MTAWSSDEIEDARQHIYTQPELSDYRSAFACLEVCRAMSSIATRATLSSCISAVERCRVERSHSTAAVDRSQYIAGYRCARLVTHEVDAELQLTRVRWMPDRIGRWAMQSMPLWAGERRVGDLLCSLANRQRSGDAFGIAFEAFAHIKLAAGGTFVIRPEDGGPAQKLTLKPSRETVFFDLCRHVPDQVQRSKHTW